MNAQQSESESIINVLIDADKNIMIENTKVDFDEIGGAVKNIISNRPQIATKRLVYRIFADESLKLGYIIDVEQELFKAFSDNTRRERYLLNLSETNLDEPNWLDKLNELEIKALEQ